MGCKPQLQNRAKGLPAQFRGLAGDQDAVVADVLHQSLDQFDGRRAHAGEADDRFFVLTGIGKSGDRRFVELAGPLKLIDQCRRMTEVARRARIAQDLVRYREKNLLDRGPAFRRDHRQQPRANGFRGLRDQVLKQLRWHVHPHAEIFGEPLVFLGAVGELDIAAFGKCRALVLRQLVDHGGVATLYQDVGDSCREALAFGDRAQMALALPSAISIRSLSVSCVDCASTGPATAISS